MRVEGRRQRMDKKVSFGLVVSWERTKHGWYFTNVDLKKRGKLKRKKGTKAIFSIQPPSPISLCRGSNAEQQHGGHTSWVRLSSRNASFPLVLVTVLGSKQHIIPILQKKRWRSRDFWELTKGCTHYKGTGLNSDLPVIYRAFAVHGFSRSSNS